MDLTDVNSEYWLQTGYYHLQTEWKFRNEPDVAEDNNGISISLSAKCKQKYYQDSGLTFTIVFQYNLILHTESAPVVSDDSDSDNPLIGARVSALKVMQFSFGSQNQQKWLNTHQKYLFLKCD